MGPLAAVRASAVAALAFHEIPRDLRAVMGLNSKSAPMGSIELSESLALPSPETVAICLKNDPVSR
jgi:pyridoxal biosynthesis lyase PdxS